MQALAAQALAGLGEDARPRDVDAELAEVVLTGASVGARRAEDGPHAEEASTGQAVRDDELGHILDLRWSTQ